MAELHPLETYRNNHEPPLSRADLAEMLGVKRATVHRWETHKRKIDLDLLPTVSEITGISQIELRPDLARHMEAAQ